MTGELPKVEIAIRSDEDQVLGMCRRLWEENGLFSYNENKVRECLRLCYAREENEKGAPCIVGVIKGENGTIEASTCLMVSDFYYTDDWHLAELWNYVQPEYRKSRNAEALIKFGKDCSDTMKVPFFTGIITNKRMSGKVKMYQRLLGPPTGAFFVHNGRWQSEPMEDHRDLERRLRESAEICNNNKADPVLIRRTIAPLLSEAAKALAREDNIWSSPRQSADEALRTT